METTPMETDSSSSTNDAQYLAMKSLEQQLDFICIQEEYILNEMKNLKRELLRAGEEIKRIQSVPLVIGQFNELIDANYGIVSSTAGSNYYVRILSTLSRESLKPNTSVALHRHSHAVVDVLPPESDSSVQLVAEKPDVTWKDIGGMDMQKQEVSRSGAGGGEKETKRQRERERGREGGEETLELSTFFWGVFWGFFGPTLVLLSPPLLSAPFLR